MLLVQEQKYGYLKHYMYLRRHDMLKKTDYEIKNYIIKGELIGGLIMTNVPREVYFVYFLSIVFWLFIVLSIIVIGKRNEKVGNFKDKMIKNWKQSLVIAVISYLATLIGAWNISYINNIFSPIQVFCQCLIGLTIAKSIGRFEPLPVVKAIKEHKHQWRKIILMIAFGVLIAFLSVIVGQVSGNICKSLFNEVADSSEAIKMLPQNKWLLFFTFLSGAGIAEETVYRLIFLSLFWKLTNKRWVAIILSSLFFGAYHLTPLSAMYKIFWQFPISQFVGTSLAGVIFGYFYMKRGYETAVLGHTFTDWLPVIIFMK